MSAWKKFVNMHIQHALSQLTMASAPARRTKVAAKVGMIQLSDGIRALNYAFHLDEGAIKACSWLDKHVDGSIV